MGQALVDLLASPQVTGSIVAFIVAMLGVGAAYLKRIQTKLSAQISAVHAQGAMIGDDARVAREQTANDHGPNFRDDMDAFREEMRAQFQDLRAAQSRFEDDAKSQRDRLDHHMDDVRASLRNLDGRITRMEDHAVDLSKQVRRMSPPPDSAAL